MQPPFPLRHPPTPEKGLHTQCGTGKRNTTPHCPSRRERGKGIQTRLIKKAEGKSSLARGVLPRCRANALTGFVCPGFGSTLRPAARHVHYNGRVVLEVVNAVNNAGQPMETGTMFESPPLPRTSFRQSTRRAVPSRLYRITILQPKGPGPWDRRAGQPKAPPPTARPSGEHRPVSEWRHQCAVQ